MKAYFSLIFIVLLLLTSCTKKTTKKSITDSTLKITDSLENKIIVLNTPSLADTTFINPSIRKKVVYFKIVDCSNFENWGPEKVVDFKFSNDTLTLKLQQIVSGNSKLYYCYSLSWKRC